MKKKWYAAYEFSKVKMEQDTKDKEERDRYERDRRL
jgi:hypothetical protein